ERDDRVVRLPAHVKAAVRPGLEQQADRNAERRREFPERVQRWREPSRLDLRQHAGRQTRLFGELSLLELTLGPQRLDPLPEAGHACSLSEGSPANALNARLTNTRVIFFR